MCVADFMHMCVFFGLWGGGRLCGGSCRLGMYGDCRVCVCVSLSVCKANGVGWTRL